MATFPPLTGSAALAPIVVVGLIGAATASEPQPDSGTAGATEDKPASAVLEAIIEQNLVRLNDGVEGRFTADIGGYGDLDGDGLEDGLVFFIYDSERLKHARFVAAYLNDGESYTLAAHKPVAGSDDNIHSADIDSIEEGVISLRLSVLEPGDAACCPSGERQQRLVLRDGQLLEVTSLPARMPGQAEETLATKPSQEPMALAVPRADDTGESEERAKSGGDEPAAEARASQAETDLGSPERSFETAARSGVATRGLLIENRGMPAGAKRTERHPTTDRRAGIQTYAPQAAPAGNAANSETLVGGSPSSAQVSQATPLQPGRSLQAPADQATPGAARLEASSLDDRPAAAIRVFIHHVAHYQGDAALARQLADHLRRRGFIVADIRPVDFSIGKPSVRYFFARDRAASQDLVKEVSQFFEETPSHAPDEASDFTHYMPKPRPGNVEVWLPVS
jgi:hypothetical protein